MSLYLDITSKEFSARAEVRYNHVHWASRELDFTKGWHVGRLFDECRKQHWRYGPENRILKVPPTPARVLVCGGRDYNEERHVFDALDDLHARLEIACVIHGACHAGGADRLADAWAVRNGVAVESVPVDHFKDGPWPGAGPRRNRRMLDTTNPDFGVAFPGGNGTAVMMCLLWEAGIRVWEPVK